MLYYVGAEHGARGPITWGQTPNACRCHVLARHDGLGIAAGVAAHLGVPEGVDNVELCPSLLWCASLMRVSQLTRYLDQLGQVPCKPTCLRSEVPDSDQKHPSVYETGSSAIEHVTQKLPSGVLTRKTRRRKGLITIRD